LGYLNFCQSISGNSDLVRANSLTNNVSLLLGNGDGTFGAATYFNAGSGPWTVAVADINGDGNSDLATANRSSKNVSILLGNGNGTFGAATNLSAGSLSNFVVVGDFNKDGKSDLATANLVNSSVSILLQNANGTFGPATNFTVGNNPNYIAIADFNGDNNPDLATSNPFSNNVSILLGDGTGSFSTATNFSVGEDPSAIVTGDFNADGKLDLATANNLSGNVSVLFGSGNGSFGTATNFVVGDHPQGIVVGDFNKDGLSDLATANHVGQNTSILLNTPNTVNFGAATYSDTEGTTDTVVNIPITISGGTPFADVVVPIVIDKSSTATLNSDYTIFPTNVTFPAGATGAALTQNVAVTIKPDNLPENAETAILNFGKIIGGVAGTTKQTTLTIAANGTVSYAIAAGTASIAEGNSGTTPLTFTATRSGSTGGASSVNYTIAGTATNASDYNNIGGTSGATAVTGTINFAAGETSKTITLDVLGDALVEPDETIAVTLSSPTGPGPTPTITTATATTTITNDDVAGFTVNPLSGLTTTEVGGKAEFTVKLNAQPTADVTIGLTSSNTAEGRVSTNSLTFTQANYNQPQTITVSGLDDLVADGPQPYKIFTAAAVSTDANYNNLDPDDVTVTNIDDEIPGITVNPTAGLTTGESGTKANFAVVLNTQPIANVTIGLNSNNLGEGTVSTNSLTFTPANWNTPQQVTVTGVEDSIADGDIDYKIVTGAAVSTDANYNNRDVADVSLTNQDNDTPGVSITPTQTTATEGGANGIYRAVLQSQPIADVTITLTTGNQIGAIAPLTFTANNWNVAQTVTVQAVDDRVVEGAHSGNITHSVSSTDTKYNGLMVPGVTVAIADNDVAPRPPTPTPTPTTGTPTPRPTPTPTTGTPTPRPTPMPTTGTPTPTPTPTPTTGTPTPTRVTTGTGGTDTFPIGIPNSNPLGITGSNNQILGIATVSFSQATYQVNESPTGIVQKQITLTRTGDLSNISTVYLAFPTGSATVGTDWKVLSNFSPELTFNPGENSKTFTIDILPDNQVEGTEEIVFRLERADNAMISVANTTTLQIFDAEGPPTINFSPATYQVNESPTEILQEQITLTRTGNLNNFSRVYLEPPTGSATFGTDWNVPPNFSPELTFNPGEDTKTFTIDIFPDGQFEGTEEIAFQITNRDNAIIGTQNTASLKIINAESTLNNNPPVLNNPIRNQGFGSFRSDFKVILAADTFTDNDPGDSLTYSYSIIPESQLLSLDWLTFDPNTNTIIPPDWLKFDPNTLTFSVDLNAANVPSPFWLPIRVTATDNAGATAIDNFTLFHDSISGLAIDGYISGATVFLDANKNGILDTNEPSTTTDSNGEFNLNIPFDIFDTNKNGEIDPSEGNLVVTGGIDTATGLPLETPLTAPPDSSVVTLLTSLIADLIDKGIAPESAQSLVKAALGLPTDVNLTSLDPIDATNNNQPGGVQVLAAMVKVQNFITQTAALIDGAYSAASHDIVKAVVSSITNQIQSGTVLNLSNAAALEPIIQQAAAKIQQIDPSFNSQTVTQITSQAATVMATANQRIDSAVSNPTGTSIPESLARLQQVALGPTTQDFRQVGTGNKPISQVVADNTGTALDSKIEAVVLPAGIATPVVTGDADLGSNSPNAILGTNGDDIMTGGSTKDVLMGMRGNNSLDGGLGNDTIFGGKGSDTLLRSSGDDALFGNRGADILNGDDGNDILYGGKGDDLLTGGFGVDSLIGGMGVDKFLLSTNSGTDTITDFEVGKDLLVLGNGLSFSQLAIAQDSGATLIRFAQTGEILAYLTGVSANSISAVNFGLI